MVVGAPQIGKSWFVEHLLHQHGSAGDQWLRLLPPREGAEPRVIVEGEGSVSATHEALTEWLAGQLSAASGRVFVVLDALERWPAIEGVSVRGWRVRYPLLESFLAGKL